MEDSALDHSTGLDRDGWSKDAAIQTAGDDDLTRDDVTFDMAASGNDQFERCNVASHAARDHKLACDLQNALNADARAEEGWWSLSLVVCGPAPRALDL